VKRRHVDGWPTLCASVSCRGWVRASLFSFAFFRFGGSVWKSNLRLFRIQRSYAKPRVTGRNTQELLLPTSWLIGHLKLHVRVNQARRAFRSRRHPIFTRSQRVTREKSLSSSSPALQANRAGT